MRRLSALSVLLVATVLVACATLPPAKPVQDLRTIAGKWEGTFTAPFGTFPYALTIKEDGSWEGLAPTSPFPKSEGTMAARDGKVRSVSKTTGITYTITLHEGEGQRILSGRSEDGSVTFRLTPAK